ncbi:MAG: hypothetical protein WC072_07150 [Methanoregulaceae archaeon]
MAAMPGETKPIGTICPSCGSTNVELAGGEGECKDCGAKYRVRLVIDDIVVPDTAKATEGPAEVPGEEEELPMPEGLGAATAPAAGPMAMPPPAGAMPPMPMAASIEWYTGPEQFVKVAELKHGGVANADIPGPKPAGMVCVSCGNHDVKTVDGRCHCTECGTISTASVRASEKHPGYLLNEVKVILPDVTAGKILGPGIPDGSGPVSLDECEGKGRRVGKRPKPFGGKKAPPFGEGGKPVEEDEEDEEDEKKDEKKDKKKDKKKD